MNITRIAQNAILEALESFVLLLMWPLCTLILSGFAKIPSFRVIWHQRVLYSIGLLSPILRSMVALKLGLRDRGIATLESVVGSLEEELPPQKSQLALVLADLYSVLVKAYLSAGDLDDAALTVIRANNCIRVQHLPGIPELSVKIAHVVKAGMAAARMLDEEMAVLRKPTDVPPPPPSEAKTLTSAKVLLFPGLNRT